MMQAFRDQTSSCAGDCRQAVLITAYKDESQLIRLVDFFSRDMLVLVHLDAKSSIDADALRTHGAQVFKTYRVGWGSYRHLWAVVDLLREALRDNSVGYLHVISGQDLPLHPIDWYKTRFGGCPHIYSRCIPSTDPSFDTSWYEHYHGATFLDLDQRTGFMRRVGDLSRRLQSFLRIRRRGIGALQRPFKGLVYLSLPRDAAQYIVTYFDEHARFRWALRSCLIPEELCFMTILANSPYVNRIAGEDLRYCDWSERNGAYPAYLDESDYDRIFSAAGESEFAFARKVDSNLSQGLIGRIADRIGF